MDDYLSLFAPSSGGDVVNNDTVHTDNTDNGNNNDNNIDNIGIYEINYLSSEKELVLYVLVVISASLSILGSSTIVYKVLRNIKSKATPYDRIMLGLSGCDIVASMAYLLSPFLAPADTSQRRWSIGSHASCSFLGFLTQFAFAAVIYNMMLSYYYLLTVRFGVKRQVFAKKYEIWMHIISLTFGFATAITGVAIGLYSELDIGYGCWINDYPNDCELPDGPECTGQIYGMIFAAVPTVVTFVTLLVNNCIIYCYVRKNLLFRTTSNTETTTTTTTGTTVAIATNNQNKRRSLSSSSSSKTSLPLPNSPAYNDRVREVATQGILYVGTFLIAFTPAFVWRCIDAFRPVGGFDENDIYGLMVVMSITLPLQGFLDVLVYNRPNIVRVRRAFPQLSTFAVIRRACLSSDIPRLTEIVVSSHKIRSSQQNHQKKKRQQQGNNNINEDNPPPEGTYIMNKTTTYQSKSISSGGASFWSNLDVLPEDSIEDVDELNNKDSKNNSSSQASSTKEMTIIQEVSESPQCCDDDDNDDDGNTFSDDIVARHTPEDFFLEYYAKIQENSDNKNSNEDENQDIVRDDESHHKQQELNDDEGPTDNHTYDQSSRTLEGSGGRHRDGFQRISMDGSLQTTKR